MKTDIFFCIFPTITNAHFSFLTMQLWQLLFNVRECGFMTLERFSPTLPLGRNRQSPYLQRKGCGLLVGFRGDKIVNCQYWPRTMVFYAFQLVSLLCANMWSTVNECKIWQFSRKTFKIICFACVKKIYLFFKLKKKWDFFKITAINRTCPLLNEAIVR